MPLNNSSLVLNLERKFFTRHGERLFWYRGSWCSCAATEDGLGNELPYPTPDQADPTCLVCGGSGYFVFGPATEIVGVVSKVNPDIDLIPEGFNMDETLILSQQPDVSPRVSTLDLIVPEWPLGQTFMGQLIVRGTDSADSLFYEASKVESVSQSNAATGAVVQYTDGTDYTVSGASITWIGATPAVGTVYSIKYAPEFQYVCFVPPMTRVERGTDIGQRVIMYKRHMLYPNTVPNVVIPTIA